MKNPNFEINATSQSAPKAPPSGKLVKRTEAARILNMSVSSLRRYEHELQPIVAANGVHMFDEVVVRSAAITLRHRRTITTMGPNGGDIAADVFTLLDDGAHPVDIVKQLRVAPDVVAALQEQWTQMRGGLFMTKDQVFELGCISRRYNPRTAASAIADLRRYVDLLKQSKQGSSQCRRCRQQTACVCEPCVVDWRGPVVTFGVKLERRTTEQGDEELRVVADTSWCDTIDFDGCRIATLRSDWHPAAKAARSDIAEFVEALEIRADPPTTMEKVG